MEGAVFDVREMVILNTALELLDAPPPPPLPIVKHVHMVCEDNAIWPLTPEPMPNLQRRSMERVDHYQEGVQAAKAVATRSSGDHPLATATLAIGAFVFLAAAMAIVLIVLQQKNIFMGGG